MTNLSGITFEAAYSELEQIIAQLDSGELSLDESVKFFERGRELSAYCQSLLENAELRITQINADS